MIAWRLDPEIALQSRLAFGRGARYAWVFLAAALVLATFDETRGAFNDVRSLFDRAASLLLLIAFPYGALSLRALDRRRQLDERRLTGRSPLTGRR